MQIARLSLVGIVVRFPKSGTVGCAVVRFLQGMLLCCGVERQIKDSIELLL